MLLAKRDSPINVQLPAYGVYVLESHHGPGFRMGAESHGFLELFFVLGGHGHFTIDGVVHPCGTNDLVAVPPGRLHSIHDDAGDPLALYAVCVSPDVAAHDRDLFSHLLPGTVHAGTLLAEHVRSVFRQLLFEQTRQRAFGRTMIIGHTLQLIARLARRAMIAPQSAVEAGDEPSESAERRSEIERYVAELAHRFFEHTSLDAAAEELGLSRRRFTTLFAEVTGQTWADYVTDLRIQYAKRLLRDTNRSIVAIAFECGFEELSSFYRAFKRDTGDSPAHWRNAQKRG